MGYSAIPIMPGTKRPGVYQMKEWYGTNDWQRYCERLPTDIETELWNAWPDAGVCVALDKRLKVVDIDTDDTELMKAVLSVLPDSEVKKRGKKGFSAFYRGSPAIVSAPFSVGKERVVDLLAHGRQTVMPPTIHPDTGQPYHWVGEPLEGVSIDDLPELPDNIAEQIAAALEPWGYEPTIEHHRLIAGEGETYWREINDTALKNLPAWVPHLGLKKLHKRGGGYRAIADWRHEVNSNAKGEALSIHPEGITDWGENRNYTPIDLVMTVTGGDMYHATSFLCDKLGIKDESEDDGFDIAGFISRAMSKSSVPVATLAAPVVAEVVASEPVVKSNDLVRAPRGTIDPFAPQNQGGILQQVTEWILSTARVPVQEFATIAALSFLSAFYGRRYVTPTELGLNVYLIGIAGPGFGKDHPRAAIEMLGHEAGMSWMIGPNEVTSDSAIEKVVRRRPVFVMPWDEVGILLQSMTGKNASAWARSTRKSLLELYSRSTRVWTGKEKADDKTDSSGEPVWFPTVSVLGFSTPVEFYAGITEQNFADGFMARLTIIGVDKRPQRKEGRSVLKSPTELISNLKKSYMLAPQKGNLASIRDSKQKPTLHTCEWGEGAHARWLQIEKWQQDFMDDKPDYEGIVGRSAEQTQKLASLRAISRNPARPVVEVEDVEYGWSIVQRSIDMIDDGVRKHMSSSEHEKLHKLILDHIEKAGEDGMPKSVLLRKSGVSSARPQEVDAAIKYLTETEQVTSTLKAAGAKGGRPSLRFFPVSDAA
jgi:hypothetical protein